jgi:ribosomal protein S18 acetylase RimI-like enzyme
MEHIIRDYRKSDNPGLAVMWNESQPGWPTGFGGNVAFTAERVANDMKRQQALFYLVAEDRGKITGYCWVSSYPKEPDACYVALLNAHPAYHGKGVGKGLLLESIRRAVRLGYYRVDLHTWPSNIKAVPLYKKTGFFWLPETQVHMQNYIPAALAHPLCRSFFSRHDWYCSFVRTLDQEPDEIKQGKRKVFPYRFQAGDEFVEVTFDMESRRVCAVETNRARARLVLDDPEVIVGKGQKAEIKCESKDGGKINIAWLKPRVPKISLKPEGWRAELVVDPEMPVPEESLPALSVGARVTFGRDSFALRAGIRPKQPVELEWHPSYPDASPGGQAGISVSITNNTGKRAAVSLEVEHKKVPQVVFSGLGKSVGPEGRTGCLLTVANPGQGVVERLLRARVRAGAEVTLTKRYRIPVFNVGHGKNPALWRGERKTVWETPDFRAVVERRGGQVRLIEKQGGRNAAIIESALGPPFWPSEFANLEHKVALRGGGLVVSAESQQVPGLRFEKMLAPSGQHAVEVRHRVFNGSKASGRYQVSLSVWGGGETPRSRKVFPLRQGVIGISGPNPFGGLSQELPKRPEDFSENWWANEDGGSVTGVVWKGVESIEYPSLVLDAGLVKPKAAREAPPVTIVFGPGDHTLVRRWFLHKQRGQDPEDYRRVGVIPRISASFDPPVLFMAGGEAQAKSLVVRNLSNQEMPAKAAVDMPGGVRAEAASPSVNLGHDLREDVKLAWRGTGPSIGTISGTVGIHPLERKFGIIPCGGRPEPVEISRAEERGLEVWSIDNGLCRFKASPQFLGSLFSWTHGGRELLMTAFPEPGNFSWERPWYGGIAPVLNPANGWGRNMLVKEKFSAIEDKVEGKTGLLWRGVKTACRPADKKAKGLLVEVSYLTLARCPVMAVLLRIRNATRGYFHMGGEVMGFVSPGGGHQGTRLRWDEEGRERGLLRGDKGAWAESERWAAAENPDNGASVTIAIPRDQSRQAILLMDYGRDGGHLGLGMDVRLKAGEARQFLSFWGAAGNPEEARAFRHLSELTELP